jgi:hypothetical protein
MNSTWRHKGHVITALEVCRLEADLAFLEWIERHYPEAVKQMKMEFARSED